MDNPKELDNDKRTGINLQKTGKEDSRKENRKTTSQKRDKEINVPEEDLNSGTLAQDYDVNQPIGAFAGLYEEKIQLDSNKVSDRAKNILNIVKKGKMTASGKPRDVITINPDIIVTRTRTSIMNFTGM